MRYGPKGSRFVSGWVAIAFFPKVNFDNVFQENSMSTFQSSFQASHQSFFAQTVVLLPPTSSPWSRHIVVDPSARSFNIEVRPISPFLLLHLRRSLTRSVSEPNAPKISKQPTSTFRRNQTLCTTLTANSVLHCSNDRKVKLILLR